MAERSIAGRPVENTLLLRMPAHEFGAIAPFLEPVALHLGQQIQTAYRPVIACYFFNQGIGSMVVTTADGRAVEVGIVGREDMISLHFAAGLPVVNHDVIVQAPGEAFRISAETLKELLSRLPELRALLFRQLAVRGAQTAQNAACNRLHSIRQRLARWLLASNDRVGSHVILMTHEFLAMMVGTDRPSISVALSELERDGVIARGRGSLSILGRRRLEKHACECYAALQRLAAE